MSVSGFKKINNSHISTVQPHCPPTPTLSLLFCLFPSSVVRGSLLLVNGLSGKEYRAKISVVVVLGGESSV